MAKERKAALKPSALIDTRVIYCGDNLGEHVVIVPLTVREILDEHIAQKLA